MKRKLVLGAVVVALACGSAYSADNTVFVAPNSATVRDGSAAHPFATPGEAQEALRALKKKAPNGGPWTISLAAGEYPIDKPLTLLPEDSGSLSAPVTWRGPADGSARIVGARELKGWCGRGADRDECRIAEDRQDVPTVAGERQRRSRGRDGSALRGPRAARLPSEARIARGEGGVPSVRHLRRRRIRRAGHTLKRNRPLNYVAIFGRVEV